MTRSFTFVLMAVLTLVLFASEAHAGRRHDGRRCRKDAQCLSGICDDGRCAALSGGFGERAVMAAGKVKPPPSGKCTNNAFCGACGVCIKGRCTGGDTGRCSACQVCSQDGSACTAVPDGSAGASEYQGCGPDALGGLACCGGSCVDTLTSIDNCGACGNACTNGKSCQYKSGGGVECRCKDWESECNGSCADLQKDPNNCGQCGHVCASGVCDDGVCTCDGGASGCGDCETCSNGLCQPTCGGDQTCCDKGCVDTRDDPDNCGGCGNACSAGQMCCDGGCVDTTSDPNNCGFCGSACAEGDVCENGLCRPSLCQTPWFSCGVSYPPHVSDVCCLPGNQCCIGGRNTSCYSEGTCCVTAIGDAFICGAGQHCCPNSINVPCLPDGTACPPS
jgi:hypothetical protein